MKYYIIQDIAGQYLFCTSDGNTKSRGDFVANRQAALRFKTLFDAEIMQKIVGNGSRILKIQL